MSRVRTGLLVGIVLGSFLAPGPAQAQTTVGGVLTSNTTWAASGSPYRVTSTVQIPEGMTLTIEPGVEVEAASGVTDMFLVHGTVNAIGTSSSRIYFDGAGSSNFFSAKSSPASMLVHVEYADISNGQSLWPATGYEQYGQLILRHSHVSNVSVYSYIWYPQQDVFIEYNTFVKSRGFSVGTGTGTAASASVKVYIRWNRFVSFATTGYSTYPAWVWNWASYGQSQTVVNYNVFESIPSGTYALYLPPGYDDAAMDGTNNYWGTTDPSLIAQRIYDKNDDITVAGTIPFEPVLSSPDPSVPPQPPEPEPTEYRSITSLSLRRHLVATGTVTFVDGQRGECRIRTGIIQRRRSDGRWVKVQVFDAPSGDSYTLRLPDKPGTYRAKTVLFSSNELDVCRGSTSPTTRHRH
jgi:hypothetical protein